MSVTAVSQNRSRRPAAGPPILPPQEQERDVESDAKGGLAPDSPRVANLSDTAREQIKSILDRAITKDRESRGEESSMRPKSIGVYYMDPPGVCIPVE